MNKKNEPYKDDIERDLYKSNIKPSSKKVLLSTIKEFNKNMQECLK